LKPLAGAGGFEPPHGGTKIRCLTAWLRPNRTEPRARIIWSFDGAQGPARSRMAAKDISRLAAYIAARVLIKRRAKGAIVRLIAAPPQRHSTPIRKPIKRLFDVAPRGMWPAHLIRGLPTPSGASFPVPGVGMIAAAARWQSDICGS
jgi:hypothetical protein